MLLGVSFIPAALVKTAMTSPLLFLPSVTMCQHCSRCVVARLVSSACKTISPSLRVPRAFLHVPRAFLRVPRALLFKTRNVVD